MVLRPDRKDVARAIFEKWELDFAVIGHLTDTGRIVVKHHGEIEADIPLDPLAEEAPLYHRPPTPLQASLGDVADPVGIRSALLTLIACPDLCSRAWVWNQYDSTIGGQTIRRPGAADAAVVRIEDHDLALALTTDCTPRYCQADPAEGGKQAVAEAWRNLCAVGARPLAITDNMNFGNPEKPEIMGQFAAAIEGMAEACRALDFPVVSGNVSLYNETEGTGILPTPAIGGVGVIEHAAQTVGIALPAGAALVAGEFVRGQIMAGRVRGCHDVSDGGLLVAVAEMAMAGSTGVTLSAPPDGVVPHAYWFGEDQGRYVLAVADADATIKAAKAAHVPARLIGHAGGAGLTLDGAEPISIGTLKEAHERFFAEWMRS